MDDEKQERKGWRRLWRSDIPWYKNFWFDNGWAAAFFVFVLVSALFYKIDTASYRQVYEHPCDYCQRCAAPLPVSNLNVSFNMSGGAVESLAGDREGD